MDRKTSNTKPKPRESKPKPKPKQNEIKESNTKYKRSGITIIQEKDNLNIDRYYEKKVNSIINKIKEQNQMIDDKIRFGWNSIE